MSYFIQQSDKNLVCQRVLDVKLRLDVYDNEHNFIDSIECGLISGGCNIDASSAVRRTANFVLIPYKKINTLIEENSLIWINRNVIIYIGIKSLITQKYVWYIQGHFLINDFSSTYDATTNQLTINCVDKMAELDGSKNGQLGALITSFPAYKEYLGSSTSNYLVTDATISTSTIICNIPALKNYQNGTYLVVKMPVDNPNQPYIKVNSLATLPICDSLTGLPLAQGVMKKGLMYSLMITSANTVVLANPMPIEKVQDGTPLSYNRIRDAVITALTRLGNVKDYNVDDIGEFYAMPDFNKDFQDYRKENPLWNIIPYDLEFNVGDNVLSVLTALRDLYPNYEMFFDENGVFITQMIPSTIDDDVYINNDFLQKILISENFTIDSSKVKNVTQVWGKCLEVDFTSNSCVLSGDTYKINVDELGTEWLGGDMIAITFDKTNPLCAKVSCHSKYTVYENSKSVTKEADLPAIPLMDQMTDMPLLSNTIVPGATYVCKVRTKIIAGKPTKQLYFLSQYQPQAINVLTDGTTSDENWKCANGKVVKKYSIEYFRDFYNCRVVSFTVEPQSSFTIQKIGVVLNVHSGDEYENIESDQRALARAEYENWKTAILTDQITLVVKLCPWLDVNKKVEYRRSDQTHASQYLIQSVAHDPAAGTTTIVMNKFRPLYKDDDYIFHPIHQVLAEYTHKELNIYTHHKIWKGR